MYLNIFDATAKIGMEIGNDQSYQDFFDKLRSESGPRNLRQIFEDDDRPLANESSSLRYQPGRSKKSQAMTRSSTQESGDSPPAAWNTAIAKVVHAYQSSENVGRVGLALSILGEMEATKLIVYRSKSQVLTTLQLTPRGGKVILRESYLQFYDDEQRFWSLRFDKEPDEKEFVTFMVKNKLPVEHYLSEISSSSSASPSREDLSKTRTKATVTKTTPNPPQPQPRSRVTLPTLEKADDEEPERETGTPSNEDVIVTPLPRPIGSSNAHRKLSSSSLAVATAPPSSDSPLAVTTLDKYLDEQRASGALMEHKMDAILKAMNRMGGQTSVAPEKPSDPLLERDSEDEMLELEQKLLNFKRENRALMRNLKAREQALEDLRCSACALCEELLVQNGELKAQNAQLLLASQQHNSDFSTAASPADCRNCETSSRQIAKMQRHISALQEALRIFQKSGDSSSSSGRL
ncbi:uncharacterized protein LOC27209170 [Drosophila simulans]|uniref:uncharacterized protein LOC27209170 n=1 Tax=Drosophila simulans TaxID=7240 RepID=UPI00078AE14E|nr:uncharacterized protein LOC27209170 [Drosophila simulans]KMZ08467.1 uncharacterized protein Dsimw501_GD29327 [Drosophila simulans]